MDVGGRSGQQTLGYLGVAGGLAMLAGFLPIFPWDSPLVIPRIVLFNVGTIAIALAVNRSQTSVGRRLSRAAAATAIAANAWYLVMVLLSIGRPQFPEPDASFRPILFYAAIALWLTDAAFGFVAARLGNVSRRAALAVAIGSLLALTGVGGLGLTTGPWRSIIEPLSLAGLALLGTGLLVLGIELATRREARAVA
jgi:hypothetical protein